MTDSLRQKQIREILDVWQNVGQQVFQREKRQAQVMEEGVLPKKERDYETEVGITKGVEGMNRLLESKLLALEQALTSNSAKAFSEVMSVADVVNGFNALVRLYGRSGLSRDSQESAKVRFQDLADDINAVVYGYEQLLDKLFSQINPSPDVLNVMRAGSVYRAIKAQLYESHSAMAFAPLTQGDIQIAYKDFYAEQSQERRDILNRLSDRAAPDRTLTSLPLRNFPVIGSNIDERIAALEAEHGITLSDQVKNQMRQVKPGLVSGEFAQFKAERDARERINTSLSVARQRLANARKANADKVREIDELRQEYEQLVDAVSRGEDADGEELEQGDIEQMNAEMNRLKTLAAGVARELEPSQQIIDEMETLIPQLEAELRRIAVSKAEEYQQQKDYDPSEAKSTPMSSSAASSMGLFESMMGNRDVTVAKVQEALKKLKVPYSTRDKREILIRKYVAAQGPQQRLQLTPQPQRRPQQVEGEMAAQAAPMEAELDFAAMGLPEAPEEKDEREGQGKPLRMRGLASMRRQYGHEYEHSESDPESDMDEYLPQRMRRRACEFDDTRNDMYD
jgi:hypothetical protein